ncbi:MAG: glycogen synthase GlgA [Steroidobacteraceae bacterium]|jgi:starch synthase|nr:glycogen synthase GlgA [Steroidobacteraceae bacterium]
MRLSICMLASEATPFAKTGGLADVAGALTKQLHAAGHDVRLVMPLYAQVDRAAHGIAPVEGFADLPLEFGPHRLRWSLHAATLPRSGARAWFIDVPALYARGTLYTDEADEHLRFIALTRAALELCQRWAWAPQVLHCNDWHAAFAPLLLKTAYGWDRLFDPVRTVLTIHNIGYQGEFPASRVPDLGIGPPDTSRLHQDDLRAGRVNALKHGILYADAITTVSPTYAQEIMTPQYGMGLEGVLRQRAAQVRGILNGVDYDDWDPRRDRWLPRHFDADSLEVKAALKTDLMARLRLEWSARTALLGIVSRFTPQKGLDLLFDTLPPLLASRDAALVALGNGDARYEVFFEGLQARFPGRVVYHRGYDEGLAHWIEAAADIFLMPSLYEPCGLNQMYSLRYGTIPVVRRTGGLADSVRMFDPASGSGTGIVFNDFDAPAMDWAMRTALDLFAQPRAWSRLVRNAMAEDFSWERQAREYEALYRGLLSAA